jgi:hypothetical protein
MTDRKNGMVLQQGIMICFILSLVFLPGCLSSQPERNQSPTITPSNVPIVPMNISDQSYLIQKDTTTSNPIQVTVYNVTVYSVMQKSGKEIKFVTLDVSLKNIGLKESFSVGTTSLICFEGDDQNLNVVHPVTGNNEGTARNTLPQRTIAPGEKIRGTVVFELIGDVESIVLYVKTPDWIILGDAFIPDISQGTQSISDSDNPKHLGLVIHSAVQKSTMPGFNLGSGSKIAIVNVSIINHNQADVKINRENLFIQTEGGMTLEHGGERVSDEMARNYLRFPITIHPDETVTGPVIYIVKSGTRINKLVLIDNRSVINSIIDLNNFYQYE